MKGLSMKRIRAVLLPLLFLAVGSQAQTYDTNNDVAEIFAGSGAAAFLDAQG